jgi:membrane fusion protein (multidrug efflux system)
MNKRTKKTVANIIIILLILIGIGWISSNFIHLGGEYTDNAQVEQNLVCRSASMWMNTPMFTRATH